ncbi:MAG: MgtC/SapB family protein [Chloroflexota bacterium]|jgi:putative Mg2+ transporter-C (MgtC) family protein|nr:MAG: MgtC/SapB family protein [Chloroflexota bacterium]
MTLDLALQSELAGRLLLAAICGAAIGIEREIHDHPAGMRTHLLVALGASLFAIISGYGYEGVFHAGISGPPDPTRIAAQIVSGIGFLGAGAILHQGNIIRGLTTAASLWATAAVGLAVGTGQYLIGLVGVIIIVFSLWPLNTIVARIHPSGSQALHLRLELASLAGLAPVTERLVRAGTELSAMNSRKLGKGRYEITLDLRLPARTDPQGLVAEIGGLVEVELVEASGTNE